MAPPSLLRAVGVAAGIATLGACSAKPDEHPAASPAAATAEVVSWPAAPAHQVLPAGGVAPKPIPLAPAEPVRVLVAGDLLPHRPMLAEPSQLRTALAPLRPLFASADVVIANHEAATGDPSELRPCEPRSSRCPDRMVLVGSEDWMGEASRAGVRALTLANNHACDRGARGVEAAIDAAEELGVTLIGADESDPWRARTLAERDGHRVCAVAWTTLSNVKGACLGAGKIAFAPVGRAGTKAASRAVERARAEGCDAVVAIFHGGREYEAQEASVLAMADAVATAGADAVVVHHPHVVSSVRVVATPDGRRVPVFASVGNLVGNQGESWTPSLPPAAADPHEVYRNGWTRLGMIADLAWRWPDGRPELVWGYHLVYVDNDHVDRPGDPAPTIDARLLDVEGDAPIVAAFARDARRGAPLFDSPCWLDRSAAGCQ